MVQCTCTERPGYTTLQEFLIGTLCQLESHSTNLFFYNHSVSLPPSAPHHLPPPLPHANPPCLTISHVHCGPCVLIPQSPLIIIYYVNSQFCYVVNLTDQQLHRYMEVAREAVLGSLTLSHASSHTHIFVMVMYLTPGKCYNTIASHTVMASEPLL